MAETSNQEHVGATTPPCNAEHPPAHQRRERCRAYMVAAICTPTPRSTTPADVPDRAPARTRGRPWGAASRSTCFSERPEHGIEYESDPGRHLRPLVRGHPRLRPAPVPEPEWQRHRGDPRTAHGLIRRPGVPIAERSSEQGTMIPLLWPMSPDRPPVRTHGAITPRASTSGAPTDPGRTRGALRRRRGRRRS